MNTKIKNRQRGSVLVMTLLVATIIGLSLISYLTLISNQRLSIARSAAWNDGVPVMEAGVEEALTQIHYNGYTNLSANQWTLGADGFYHKTRSVGSDGSYCQVAIQPVNPPVIFSTAYVPAPLGRTGGFVTRKVRVTTKKPPSGGGGITAKGSILLSGGSAWFDSFDSSLGPYSPANKGSNGVAVSNSGAVGAISLTGGATIYGSTITGPGGTVTMNPGTVTGSTSEHDANVQFNDVTAPFVWGTGLTPASGTVNGTNYNYVLSSGNYNLPGGINIGGGHSMIVTGNAVLYVNGKFDTSGSGLIYLAQGASLQFYVDGALTLSSGIVNATGFAKNLSIYGLINCTTVTISGSQVFIGTVYAPEANFTFSGSSGSYGAFTASTVTISGSGGVHYDQNLSPGGDYVAASWNEL